MASYTICFLVISLVTVCWGNLGNYLGCYLDNTRRNQLLTKFRINGTSVTPAFCFDFCRTRSYPVAGLQFSNQCYCGFSVENGISVPENECYYKCSDDNIKCGGELRLSVYETGFKENVTEGKYLGCYVDPSTVSRLMRGAEENFDGRLTNRICRHFCKAKGFAYAGTQSGKCFCSNDRPSYKSIAEDEGCINPCPGSADEICGGNLRLSIYGNSEGIDANPVISLYQGCFPGNVVGRIPLKNTNLLTTQYCVGYCYKRGYRFAGMKLGNQCYCDDNVEKVPSAEVGECGQPCRGDSFQKCGGQRHMSVYYTGIPEKNVFRNYYYVGCYSDSEQKLLNGASIKDRALTPLRCVIFCFEKSYRMAGVERGDRCYCGDEVLEEAKSIEQACQTPCEGDWGHKCGGTWKLSVYNTGLEEYEKSIQKLCDTSASIVNEKMVCKGETVFNEEFDDNALNKWSHVIQMPNEPDYPFVVFDKKRSNIFVADGKLVIKPSLMDDDKVANGKIELNNCTGLWNSEECSRKAMSYRILPPVESAMITTKESFSFLYGRIDIRAKLPRGDWLVPALWLEPKRASYGPYYRSGRMIVALARGNDDLSCGSEVMGNTRLEAGVAASALNDEPVKKLVSWESGENWANRYHNYTLTWTPDNLTFSVDGAQQKSLLGDGQRVRDLFGSSNTATSSRADHSESPMAPFDNEFYISVGLYAGGMYDFGDECNSGSQTKPWRNFDVKAMANFWQARQIWLKSWLDDKSALRVDSIKVTAV